MTDRRSTRVELVCRAGALNGESPVWDPGRRQLYWVDVRAPALHAFDPEAKHDEAWEMPAWIGCCALADAAMILALRTGLYRFEPTAGSLQFLAAAPFDPRKLIFNDGGCDRQGRFYAGPMYVPLKPEGAGPKAGPLWRYDGKAGWDAVTPPAATSNGLAFSPDGRTMYHSDTEQKTIWQYDYDGSTGALTNRRVFAEVEVADGGPDGATVDRDGFYWCAVFAQGCLLRFDPAGKLERRIEMPVQYPTMPALGGDDLSTIFVTSASWPIPAAERARRPDEGGLFAFEAPAPGLPATPFNEANP